MGHSACHSPERYYRYAPACPQTLPHGLRAASKVARLPLAVSGPAAEALPIDDLKAIHDQAKADAERAHAMLQKSVSQAVTPQMLSKFARTARQRIRLEGGGYRRDHLRALARRVEVADGEVRIMGSKSWLLQTLIANGGANAAPTQGLKWRPGRDSNP